MCSRRLLIAESLIASLISHVEKLACYGFEKGFASGRGRGRGDSWTSTVVVVVVVVAFKNT